MMKYQLFWPYRALLFALAITPLSACTGSISGGNNKSGGDDSPAPSEQPPPGNNPLPPPVDMKDGENKGPEPCGVPKVRLFQLSPLQLHRLASAVVPGGISTTLGNSRFLNVVADLTASRAPSDGPFTNAAFELNMTDGYLTQLMESGQAIGQMAWDYLSKDDCLKQSQAPDDACLGAYIRSVGRTLFRRPLTDSEVNKLAALAQQEIANDGIARAVITVVQALFVSPETLFRTELGSGQPVADGRVRLTGHELADMLSFWLLNRAPDDELRTAVDEGRLDGTDFMQVRAETLAQFRRLVAEPVPKGSHGHIYTMQREGVGGLFADYLQIKDSDSLNKEERIYGHYSAYAWASMRREFDAAVSDGMWNRGARWDQLMTDSAAYPARSLLASADGSGIYTYKAPLAGSASGDYFRIEGADLDGPRAGLLTNPFVMAAHSDFDRTSIVQRGAWLRRDVLCMEIPAPPPTVEAVPVPPSGSLTARERLAAHSVGGCAGCHRLMDPLAMGLEVYDAVGRYRTNELSPSYEAKGVHYESGRPIDTSGVLTDVTIDGVQGDYPYANPTEFAKLLVRTEEAQTCFVKKAAGFMLGRAVGEADRCAVEAYRKAFVDSEFNVFALLEAIVTSDDFYYRRVPNGDGQ